MSLHMTLVVRCPWLFAQLRAPLKKTKSGGCARPKPELPVIVGTKDKIESAPAGVGYGRWRHGFGWWGYGPDDVYTVTEGSVRIDVVDQRQHSLVWSGTAS